jgi:hypothetical protein
MMVQEILGNRLPMHSMPHGIQVLLPVLLMVNMDIMAHKILASQVGALQFVPPPLETNTPLIILETRFLLQP